ncbi:hypothetical protein [Streptomyces sp. NPDC059452]|uniref:hypothetical protein n=1 Tax=Streptomyces sp. NPDC059452 TaxID=3346835 RepID=UPI0036AB4995
MRKNSRFITAALVPTLVLGLVGLGATATASAAPAAATATVTATAADRTTGPWSAPTALTGPEGVADLIDVRTTADGDAVAVWYSAAAPGEQELRVAVRPAASTEWGPAEVLATLPEGRDSVLLVPSSDGSAAVTWVHAGKDSSVLRTATLAKGATSWSAPVDIATAPVFGELAFAGGPSGKSVATWHQNEGHKSRLFVSERSGPDGAWSEPAALVDDGASWPQALVAADGSVTVAWADSAAEGMTVKVVTKAAGAADWSAPVLVSEPYEGGAPVLSQGPDGTAALAWVAHKWLGDDIGSDIDVVSSVRAPGGTEWGALHTIQSDSFSRLGAPLVGPDGDVTLVWIDYQETLGLRTADRSAATGSWSEVRTLSSGYVSEEFDAKIGADGTVQVGWAQGDETGGEGQVFHTVARVDGVWAASTRLSEKPSAYTAGSVSVGPDGNATAVWVQDDQLWTSATGLTPEAPAV